MAVFDGFQRMSFDGIAFPVSDVVVKGSVRHHVHEFPHSPGGEPEKMGRKLYTVSLTAHFHELPFTDLDEFYPKLYPEGLSTLQRTWEAQKTADLVVPNLGTIRAFCTEWTRKVDFRGARTGELVDLQFLEDQEKDYLLENVIEFGEDFQKTYDRLEALMGTKIPEPPSVFQAINDVVTAILAISGAADASQRLLAAKIAGLTQLCSTAEREVAELQDASNWQVLEALKDLWKAAVDLGEQVGGPEVQILTYEVLGTMAIAQVSTAIYGTAERARELLDLNDIPDVFAIPPGTRIRYLRES
jgi:hypothetical protein